MSFMPRTRGGALWRSLLGSLLVVGLAAATTAVAGLLKVNDIVRAIDLTPALKNARVVLPPTGAPQTLLLIGSDHRAGEPFKDANTDTMMLVRIDDNSSTINVLSVPRDLKVTAPGDPYGQSYKLNAMYSIGGPNLLIKTLQQEVFPGLQVNHILDVNFRAFSDLIDAIGCVYADVDHRYYNDTALTGYSSIDIQPGYQKLCGNNQAPTGALAFVRFRHTDSDLVRNARQQDFLRWAKQGFSTSKLIDQEGKLTHIFGANVQTDRFLHSTDGILQLFDLVVNANGHAVKQIPFPALFEPCGGGAGQTPCYVTADPGAEAAAFATFMRPTVNPTTPSKPANPVVAAAKSGRARHHRGATSPAIVPGLTADLGDAKTQAAHLARVPFPVMLPKDIVAGSNYCLSIIANCDPGDEPQVDYNKSFPRAYEIHAPGGPYPSYRVTLVINSALGYWYGVQGTAWLHPPILNHPTQTVNVGGKKLLEYFNGHKLSLVAWRTKQAAYWVSNTLTDEIPNAQLVGIAASLAPA